MLVRLLLSIGGILVLLFALETNVTAAAAATPTDVQGPKLFYFPLRAGSTIDCTEAARKDIGINIALIVAAKQGTTPRFHSGGKNTPLFTCILV